MEAQARVEEQVKRMPWWRSWPAIGGFGVATTAAVYLSTAYPDQLLSALPYLGLLACPVMHLVMCSGMKGKGSSCHKSDGQK
ncbi:MULTISPECIES: DUF2933 domain-containing protein [Azospirillum]|uniref:DUF2933 domain-containing protein n=1 Tax=Azospirillum brasilense TaxID=192 RepID=A0A6L3B1K2_AZOBR|nr:DUF2933 domain-containing protein [Azospirillum brasilense]KAA0686153.1 DUF2933 domain-containing protein [Azospirillum brasilense]